MGVKGRAEIKEVWEAVTDCGIRKLFNMDVQAWGGCSKCKSGSCPI